MTSPKEFQEQFKSPSSILDIRVRICVNYCIYEAKHGMKDIAKKREEKDEVKITIRHITPIVRVSGGLKNDCMLELCIFVQSHILNFSILLFPVQFPLHTPVLYYFLVESLCYHKLCHRH